MMSEGQSTARSRSLKLCLKEWITHLPSVLGFSHLFKAAEAELELHFSAEQYWGNAHWCPHPFILYAAQNTAPTRGICLTLDGVFKLRHGWETNWMWGRSQSSLMSEESKPVASDNRIPVSDLMAISQRAWSSTSKHSFWILRSWSGGIGAGI